MFCELGSFDFWLLRNSDDEAMHRDGRTVNGVGEQCNEDVTNWLYSVLGTRIKDDEVDDLLDQINLLIAPPNHGTSFYAEQTAATRIKRKGQQVTRP